MLLNVCSHLLSLLVEVLQKVFCLLYCRPCLRVVANAWLVSYRHHPLLCRVYLVNTQTASLNKQHYVATKHATHYLRPYLASIA